jgi:hypothetical protein
MGNITRRHFLGLGLGTAAGTLLLGRKAFGSNNYGTGKTPQANGASGSAAAGGNYGIGETLYVDGIPDASYDFNTPKKAVYAFYDMLQHVRTNPGKEEDLLKVMGTNLGGRGDLGLFRSIDQFRTQARRLLEKYPQDISNVTIINIRSNSSVEMMQADLNINGSMRDSLKISTRGGNFLPSINNLYNNGVV